MKINFTIPILILTVYLLTNLIVPIAFKGETIFIANAVLWTTVTAAVIIISKLTQTKILQANKTLVEIAVILAVFQIFLAVFLAFFMGFGKNLNVWTPKALAMYFPYLLMPFLAMEISRAYLTQTISKHKPTLALILISLFCTLLTPTIPNYLGLTTPLAITEFLIRTFIPALAISLLATYFAYLGAFPANLTYMAIPTFFTWFSPILPNIQWQTQSILTVIAASIGFILLDQTIKPLPTPRERIRRTLKKGKSQLPYWTAITLIGLIAIWSSTGLLGFTPTIIASGSMTPTLEVGDIAVTVQTRPETIKVGDIIQYWEQGEPAPTIHRAIETYKTGATTYIVTKGDANNAPDDPITPTGTVGKVIFVIPKLGWISIYLKAFIATAWAFFANNPEATCIMLGITLISSAYGINRYGNQPLRKLRRKLKR